MIKLENCPMCKGTDWHDLDYLRDKKLWYDKDYRLEDEPVGFKICKTCGFLTYDYIETERLKDIYDRERPVMSFNNIVTCNRKNRYHEAFLKDIDFTGKTVLDVGCAQGSFLNYLKGRGANCYGTEYSAAFSSWGINEYGLKITKDIDESIKYDFISYYHVLEHVPHPDKELKRAWNLLDDNGFLYLSLPYPLGIFDDAAGNNLFSFEDLYHLNHISLFSEVSLQNLLNISGFEVVKQNNTYYGVTMLCKKVKPIEKIGFERYQDMEAMLKAQKQATELMQQGKHQEAISVYPKYPDAYILFSINKENMKNFEVQRDILSHALTLMPGNFKLYNQLAKVYFQWDENNPKKTGFYSNNIRKAEEMFLEQIEMKPGNDEVYYFLSLIEGKYKKDYKKAAEYLGICEQINPLKFAEVANMKAVWWKEKEWNRNVTRES